jgi:5'-nucleotidase
LLIVPELERELKVWNSNTELYRQLSNLEVIKAEVYRGLDSESSLNMVPPDISVLRKEIKLAREEVDKKYNKYFGSLFRSGLKPSHFAMNVERYADLYTASVLQLLNYPLFYSFTASANLPHE